MNLFTQNKIEFKRSINEVINKNKIKMIFSKKSLSIISMISMITISYIVYSLYNRPEKEYPKEIVY